MFKKSFSGHTEFSYSLQRYMDKDSGELYSADNLPVPDEEDFEFEPITIYTLVKGSAHIECDLIFLENDINIEEVTDSSGKDWQPLLTWYEKRTIYSLILDKISKDSD